jgi:predicted CXXCH cytochrome family protein
LFAVLTGGCLLLVGGTLIPALAHECAYCHSVHGAPAGGLLKYSSTEVLCLSCHSVAINDTKAAAVHNPLNKNSDELGYITCRECHTPHSSISGNIKRVGYSYDPLYNRSFGVATTPPRPVIRVELPSSDPGNPLYKTVVFQSSTDFNRNDGKGACEICHTSHNPGQDCTTCHAHAEEFSAAGGCTACHDGTPGAFAAYQVGPNSPHSENATGYSCSDCHSGHGTAGTVVIPNNPAVGINYSANGETGIALGGSATTGTTEAEICWNCHANHGVTEWGANTHAATGNSPYNYGALSDRNWVGATWSSANFSYKTGPIQSTHSVNTAASAPGVDPVGSIRCSYCHDVHELALATNDTKAGKPYLRGTWRGNPYREDGAPLSTSVYTPRHWGAVPRGSTLNNEYGGYQIDQNNGYPTSAGVAPTWNAATNTWNWPPGTWTLASSAGLCVLCHGTNVDTMNQFGTASNDWVGTNGHSNAAIGGTGLHAANIFRTSWRAPSGIDINGAKPDMGYRNHGSNEGYGLRGSDGRSFRLKPAMDGQLASNVTRPYGGQYYQWGAAVNDTTTERKYHQFSCSKCHNPHASRLPRLMITNCLDTRHNTWDDPRTGIDAINIGNKNFKNITLSATTSPDNWGRTWSNTTSAQNCHRLAGDNRVTPVPGFGQGWNKVTPW